MPRTWTEWTGALAWAEALVDWHREVHSEQWPENIDAHRTGLADTVMLLAFAIQAAARLSGQTVTNSPDDLDHVRFLVIDGFIDVRMGSVMFAADGLGPTGGQPGSGDQYSWFLRVARTQPVWEALVERVATVVRDHRAEIDPDDCPEDEHELSDRRQAVILPRKSGTRSADSTE